MIQKIGIEVRPLQEFVKIKNIIEQYQADNGEVLALDGVSLSVAQGELVSIVGPSGCGKSTLLSIVAGLEQPTHGSIEVNGKEITRVSSQIAYMLQDDNLLEWRSIYKNILLGLEIQKKKTPENIAYVNQLIDNYGLGEFKQKYPSQLSGGMRQRAALIRTLAIKPELLLLDEAFSALDYQTRLQVTDDVRQILRKEGKTTIMVTHDIPEAISMSDRVVVLSARPGKVKAVHTLDFGEDLKPLERRKQPKFSEYFNEIWGELVEK